MVASSDYVHLSVFPRYQLLSSERLKALHRVDLANILPAPHYLDFILLLGTGRLEVSVIESVGLLFMIV